MAKKKATEAKPYQVFVSHATADKWIATVICERIRAAGATPFIDNRDIDGGDDIPERIRGAIKRSKEFVVLLTPHSVDRKWVTLEVGAAWLWSKAMRITVVMCHVNVDPIPDMLKSKKAIDINECQEYFAQLAARVKAHNAKQ